MYHDSDDEPLSGDEDQTPTTAFRGGFGVCSTAARNTQNYCKKDHSQMERSRLTLRTGRRVGSVVTKKQKRFGGTNRDALTTGISSGPDTHPVIVVDYDLTLVDRLSRPFPGSHEFVERLREYNGGRNTLVLYSHGSPAYIDNGLDKYYERERKHFDEIICDSSARDNKPVTHVRRVIRKIQHLVGPYVIIDDLRSNLDSDQYDIVIDVTRMTDYDEKGRAISVDYASCLNLMDQRVQAFLKTKK